MKDILITGASGFLGSIIIKKLSNYNFIKLGRSNADIEADLTLDIPTLPHVDIVLHCAGKAHSIPKTDAERKTFFDTNIKGTQNLLTAIERSEALPQSFVFISSVAVYGVDTGKMIDEKMPLAANDPYGMSKIRAEELIFAWCKKNNIVCTILRLPLLAAANPPGNLGSMINGIRKGYYFNIGGGKARKSVVLAEDVAGIIPKAAFIGGTYNLTDGCHPSFFELGAVVATQLNKKTPRNVSLLLAKLLAIFGDLAGEKFPINSAKLKKITSDLTFDDSKARLLLGWSPKNVLAGFKII